MGFVRFILILFLCSLFSGIAFSVETALPMESLLKEGKWEEVGHLLKKELEQVQKEEVKLKAGKEKVLK